MVIAMKKYDIAAFVWPSYTGDELRSRIFWPEGNGEWQTVKSATAKFDGHSWPRKPLWGYVNEASPEVMEMEINEAVSHGVNVFIYDWYWYDGRPFLENCLNDGFLKAKNSNDMKFYLMWANHNANHLWSKELSDTEAGNTLIWSGEVDRSRFESMALRLIDKYFPLDNYYKINGAPVFMIYELSTLADGLGGLKEVADALLWLRGKVKEAGFPDLHIQFCGRNNKIKNMSGIDSESLTDFSDAVQSVGADSFSHYQFVHITGIDRDYLEVLEDVKALWKKIDAEYKIPYFPHVSCGWDNNPRFKKFRPGIIKNNTPENFEKALRAAKEYVDTHELPAPLITINSWNEWTETSYLQPDDLYGYGYLDAIKRVFTE